MPDLENNKKRRSLKNLPPDRFQPKMLVIWLVYLAREHSPVGKDFTRMPAVLRWGAYLCLTAGILLFNMDSNAGFIYFNF